MNNTNDYNSCSYSQETIVPGHLFLWNTWEIRNNTPHSSSISLISYESSGIKK